MMWYSAVRLPNLTEVQMYTVTGPWGEGRGPRGRGGMVRLVGAESIERLPPRPINQETDVLHCVITGVGASNICKYASNSMRQ
jgi:hypothetical protein